MKPALAGCTDWWWRILILKVKITGVGEVVGIECGFNYNNREEYGSLPTEQSLFVFKKNKNKYYLNKDEERCWYQKDKPIYCMQNHFIP